MDAAHEDPLIVTALLDPETQAFFDDLRRAHYPAKRLRVGAHLTLFHHLDPRSEPRLRDLLEHAAARRLPLLAQVEPPRCLGGGVAYGISHPDLLELRQTLAGQIPGELTPQDAAWSWPHVTVQSKVSGTTARTLQRQLLSEPRPEVAMIAGLALWRYRSGPWEAVAAYGPGASSLRS